MAEETYRVLEKFGVALCLAESDTFEVPQVITADFVYARLRKEDYTPADRLAIAAHVAEQLRRDGTYTHFSNTKTPRPERFMRSSYCKLPSEGGCSKRT